MVKKNIIVLHLLVLLADILIIVPKQKNFFRPDVQMD